MKKVLFLFFILIFISSCAKDQVIKENIKEGPFLVVKVIDGDTLDIESGERIRLSGIDAPERGECYYKESKSVLANLTLNKTISIQQDITDIDKYGRLLRYIYLEEFLVNEYMVREGYAVVYDKYKDDTSKYILLKEIEKEAVLENKGMWKCQNISKLKS